MAVIDFITRGTNRNERKASTGLAPQFDTVSVGGASPITLSKVADAWDHNAKGIANANLDATPTNYTPSDANLLADHLAAIDTALGTAGTDENVKVSGNDTAEKFLEDAIVVSEGANSSDILEISTLNDGGDEDLQIQIDESKIDHDALSNFVSDEHVAHSGVSVVAASDAGVAASNNDLSANIGLALDIDGLTGITVVDNADTIPIDDGDGGTNRKITRANFIGSAAITMGSNLDITLAGGGEVLGLPASPSVAGAAASKAYVDSTANGLSWKQPVILHSQANLASLTGLTLTDFDGAGQGRTLIAGERVLLGENQTTASERGLYEVSGTDLVRPADFNGVGEAEGATVMVQEGDDANKGYVQTADAVTIDTTAQAWVQFFGGTALTEGDGIDIVANVVSLDLKASGGLKFDTGEVAVEPADFAGSGLEDDGADALRISAAAAGDGLAGGAGSALSVNVGDGIKILSDAVARDDAVTAQNDDAGTVTIRQIVVFEADGNFVKADKNIAALNEGSRIGIVEDASIIATASGKVVIRAGAIVGGYAGLTPSLPVYMGAAGAVIQSTGAFVAGTDSVFRVGFAHSATQIEFNPAYELLF